jgi:phage terminase large subunit-like protein
MLADEIVHWRNRDLWDSLFSATAKKAEALLIVATNAGHEVDERGKETWQFGLRENVRLSGDWYFSALDGPMASWLRAKHLEEQRRLLPQAAFDRLWMNRWVARAGDALDPDDIEKAITLNGPTGPERGYAYFGGTDLGLSRDGSAVVIVGVHVGHCERLPIAEVQRRRPPTIEAMLDNGILESREDENRYTTLYHQPMHRLRLAAVHLWKPQPGKQVDLDQVERTIIDAHQRFRLGAIACDPWQAGLLIQRLQRAGAPAEDTPFTHGNLQAMASHVMESFREKEIDLFPYPQLIADLRSLRVVEKSYGIRLDSPRGPDGHGDCATALALAILAARRHANGAQPFVQGELVAYP